MRIAAMRVAAMRSIVRFTCVEAPMNRIAERNNDSDSEGYFQGGNCTYMNSGLETS